jgi:hypothetical protein
MNNDEIIFLPLIPATIMGLIAATFENVEDRLVLMPVSVVGAAGSELDELNLKGLRQKRVVSRF